MKRDRSVSPSAVKKEEPKKDETKAEPAKTETEAPKEEVTEALKTEEPAAESTPVTALPASTDKPAESTDEAAKETPKEETPNKRSSVFGNLGRRASKAFKGMQGPKKENTTPKAEEKKTETTEADKPLTNGENKTEEAKPEEDPKSIGDVVPDAIDAGKPQSQAPPTVAASA